MTFIVGVKSYMEVCNETSDIQIKENTIQAMSASFNIHHGSGDYGISLGCMEFSLK